MKNQIFLIFCLIFTLKLSEIQAEPRKFSHVGPFPRYPGPNLPLTSQPSLNENDSYEYDYLNNVSLGRLLKDDNTLLQQTDHLSSQVKTSIASKLMNLANRLQHAAAILMDGTSGRRRSHRQNSHRLHKSRYQPSPMDDNPIASSSRYAPNNNDRRTPSPDAFTSPKPPAFAIPPISSNSEQPDSPLSVLDRLTKPDAIGIELLNKKEEEKENDKKRRDLDEIRDSIPRNKRSVDDERPAFESVTKQQLLDVASDVRSGYDSVIKLLKNYLDDPPASERSTMKRSNQRVEELLDNIIQAKTIFKSIEDHVTQQFMDDSRNQTELLSYFDKIIKVEKNRISQALNEYSTRLVTKYNDFKPQINPNDPLDSASHDPHRVPSTDPHRVSSMDPHHVPSTAIEREYQNDDDLNSYMNEYRKDLERERMRINYKNELAREEKLRREPIRPTIVVRRTYIPPKVKVNSRPTRRHPAASDRVRPAYETAISAKEPVENENDERGYEMIEP